MTSEPPDSTMMVETLVGALDTTPIHQLHQRLASVLGEMCTGVRVWVVDYALESFTALDDGNATASADNGPVGDAFQEMSLKVVDSTAFVPLARRSQRVGVLELTGSRLDERTLLAMASVIAAAILDARQYSDVVERIRGAGRFDLAATIQYEMLPPSSFEDNQVEVAGKLEPAYDIAGDTFDYAVDHKSVDIAIFDAVGHGLEATLMSSVALGEYRLRRRQDWSLAEIAAAIDRRIAFQWTDCGYVTGVLARIDLEQGVLSVWCAGHVPPILSTEGLTEAMPLTPTSPPLGLGQMGAAPTRLPIASGDTVVLYTDGVVQARQPSGSEWGIARLVDSVSGLSELPLVNLTQEVLARVVEHVAGSIQDDATLVAVRVL